MAFLTQQSFVSSLREGDMEKLFPGAWAALMRVGIWVIDPSPCFKQKYLHMPDGCISGKWGTSWKFLKCSTDINSPKAHKNVPGKCSQTPLKACVGPSTLATSLHAFIRHLHNPHMFLHHRASIIKWSCSCRHLYLQCLALFLQEGQLWNCFWICSTPPSGDVLQA